MSRSKQCDPRYFAKSQLIARGWTAKLIPSVLGGPDVTRVNPHWKTAAPMCLFWADRVVRAEDRPDVKARLELNLARRKAAAKKRADRRSRGAQ